MARIFLSYHFEDTSPASALGEALVARGHELFRFEESISIGQRWEEEIGRELRDADALVILLGEKTGRSQWVMHEAGMAIGYARERGKPLILPVLLGNAEIPSPLASIQAIISRDQDIILVADRVDRVLQQQIGRLLAQEEQQREIARRVEETASAYISHSRAELNQREIRYLRIAYLWYSLAFVSLVAGVAFAVWRAFAARNLNGWIQFAEFVAFGLVVVGLLVGLSKLSFGLGKSFMVEALRNADRSHAISFGEFYLKAYGEQAVWAEVKEAFQHWNVDKGSSFATQDAKDYDPQFAQLVIEVAKSLRSTEKK